MQTEKEINEMLTNSGYFRPGHYLQHPIVLESADGSTIKDTNGKEYLDFSAIMGAVNCGHNVPLINQRLVKQINKIWTTNLFATDIQIEAISEINSVLPCDIEVAALYSTGAEAIELALRLAREATGRKRILSFKDHFHGKTHGTMFLVKHFPECYGPVPETYRTVIDSDGTDGPAQIEGCLNSALEDDVAAVIFEPVVGYSGSRRLHKDFLRTIRKFCDKNNIIMIVDEILTGFHRCKGWFVSCQDGIKPDIIVFGKGLGNGFPISGVASNVSISKSLKNTIPGSTFAGNSLACAAACGVIDFMKQQGFPEKTSQLEKLFFEYLSLPRLKSCGIKLDGMGGLLSISFEDPSFNRMQDVYLNVLKEGVITSHTHTCLRISPPLTIALSEFERGLGIIGKCLNNYYLSMREKK